MANTNKQIVEKVNAAFAANNMEGFFEACKDDIVWKMVGEETRTGVGTIRKWMESMKDREPPKFTVETLIGDGDFVVSSGHMMMKNKEGKDEAYSYCDLYRFENRKIAELTSYVIKTGYSA